MKRISYVACLLGGAGLMATTVAGCGDDGGLTDGPCGYDFNAAGDASVGDDRINALIEATGELNVAANDLEGTLLTACNNINTDLGAETSDDLATACGNAEAAMQAVLDANASAELIVEFTPAVCTVNAQAAAQCAAECDATIMADMAPITCEGGELSGECSAMCTGTCSVMGDVACTGTCQGTCMGECMARVEGSCTGTCQGTCDGMCNGMTGSAVECNGMCEGTCSGMCTGTVEGSCSGTCMGMCQGSCRADVSGMCEGQCSGECSVEFMEPRCEGGEVNVEADAECKASCETEASVEAECTEPQVVVTFTGTADDVDQLVALLETIRENLPAILAARDKAVIAADATGNFVSRIEGATDAAAEAGVRAAACVGQAATIAADAVASVAVSVDVSVSVSATASGMASTDG